MIEIGNCNGCYTELIVDGKSHMVPTRELSWWIEHYKKKEEL